LQKCPPSGSGCPWMITILDGMDDAPADRSK